MALINTENLKRKEKNRNNVHTEVDATYTSFIDENGNKYFQIDTYSSSDGKTQGKISQSIQLDRNSAIELMKLLKKELDIWKISKTD
ncbi:hypothetical protein NSA56_06470 [Oceanobacillus caeni]|uniref:Methionyl-tRNA formyltransferase n=1 Tax=Oceanobacillus caeni TaxID=405946 RepID=A0ABR5MHB3_9BACI|nr:MULTISPECIES: hypothetical protein [Bacillaceae]KKE79427.1 hypothetical protein WH51_07965 [Bacilli bacterium VT-13-104]PZD88278.1 methionyl-tRNA formyltransferase [Bacilli bacterium]KPH73226.1 hypothetical protein AFL42_12895 [Oceanobacillus caeni]MBU8791187.1 hypothetical protein [Oceanobacillus caeni]MCR1834035.1 hypothetical protein [Oceanobacillus caeni]